MICDVGTRSARRLELAPDAKTHISLLQVLHSSDVPVTARGDFEGHIRVAPGASIRNAIIESARTFRGSSSGGGAHEWFT